MKFAYLHGYQGFVTEEKRQFLDSLGECYAPSIDYDKDQNIIEKLIEEFKSNCIDFISGTSLGGMIAYYLGIKLNVPVLMFNPAVIAVDQLKAFLPEELMNKFPLQPNYVFTGMKDDVVKPKFQIEFVEKLKKSCKNIHQIFDNEMTHLVTLEEFENAFETFLHRKDINK